jgi:hypothetical protein
MFGLGLKVVNPIAVLAVTDDDYFAQRVAADGGIMEAFGCVVEAILDFPQADLGRQLFDAYDARCEAASGDTEARVCTINELNDLL